MPVDYISLLRKIQNQVVPPGGGQVAQGSPLIGGSSGAFSGGRPLIGSGNAPTVSAPVPSGDSGGTWQMPDYAGLLEQFMAPLNAQYQAQDVSNLASRNAGFKRAAIQFGELPDVGQIASALGLSQADLANVFGSDTAPLAEGNTKAGTSTVARLNETHQDAVRQITNALASRGLLHSGETGFQQGREDLNYTRGQYDARNKLLDYLSGLQSGYASAKQQAAMAAAQARMNAAMQIQGLYQPTYVPGSGGGAPPPPAGAPSTSPLIKYGQGAFGPTLPPDPIGVRKSPYGM